MNCGCFSENRTKFVRIHEFAIVKTDRKLWGKNLNFSALFSRICVFINTRVLIYSHELGNVVLNQRI